MNIRKALILLSVIFSFQIAQSNDTVNLLMWWDKPLSLYLEKEVKTRCQVDLAYQGYVASDQFLYDFQIEDWDIIVFESTIFDLVKDKLLEKNINIKNNLMKEYPLFIRNQLNKQLGSSERDYNNLTFFSINNIVIVYDSKKISISDDTDIKSIINQLADTGKELVLLDDPNIINAILKVEGYNKMSLSSFETLFDYKNIIIQNYINGYENVGVMITWSSFALQYIIDAKDRGFEFELFEIPKYRFTTSTYIVQLRSNKSVNCVMNFMTSKDFMSKSSNLVFDFTPYANYEVVKNKRFYQLYKNFYKLGSKNDLKWVYQFSDLEESLYDSWGQILTMKKGV
ncbi:hypothetical protein IB633_03780 [Francisella philomiragia]|uniref:Bacterial extracellular solute-binding family protein n=1 Tax=Francisella philomiragia subsp. philomiragia (strain ATCC 25017 / CCUG 19701 / FSC 153 / O\|nr:hypothetical protein [Francisella philomiragia]AJI46738.1 hypothetical protein BF30_1010 [Francisella philomiragia]AJI48356.1 hypothetical protein KU46_545 [Francisella philomiragia]MBK2020516.1 hypothetical protein [Francisella philomiragia]MBK2030209.1 hypothetical protein [Francisella philomiragia]MBK2264829.1 hypothetical protein [Francisella philomiragia]